MICLCFLCSALTAERSRRYLLRATTPRVKAWRRRTDGSLRASRIISRSCIRRTKLCVARAMADLGDELRTRTLQDVICSAPHENLGVPQLHLPPLELEDGHQTQHASGARSSAPMTGTRVPSVGRRRVARSAPDARVIGVPLRAHVLIHRVNQQRALVAGLRHTVGRLPGHADGARGAHEEDAVVLIEVGVGIPDLEAAARQPHGLQDPTVSKLIDDLGLLEGRRGEALVGLDAANEMRGAFLELGHQRAELAAELSADRLGRPGSPGPRRRPSVGRVWLGGPRFGQRVSIAQGLVRRAREDRHGLVGQFVLVLQNEAVSIVDDGPRVVRQAELEVPPLPAVRREELVVGRLLRILLLVHARHEAVVVAPRSEDRLVLQLREDAVGPASNQRQALLVVREGDERPLDAFALVLLLLELEDELVEMLLQRFVRKVDAQLLEGVRLERLEAEDVQDADRGEGVLGLLEGDAPVDLGHDPGEELDVDGLGEGRAGIHGLRRRLRGRDHLAVDVDLPQGQRVPEDVVRHSEQSAGGGHGLVRFTRVGNVARLDAVAEGVPEGDLPELEHTGDEVEQFGLLLLGEVQDVHGDLGLSQAFEVVDAVDLEDAALVDVSKLLGRPQGERLRGDAELLEDSPAALARELVQHVEAALPRILRGQASLLQEIGLDLGAAEAAAGVEEQLDVLAETRRVGVPGGAGVAEGLEDRVGLEDAVGHGADLEVGGALGVADDRQVPHDELGGLGLARAGLAGDQHGLVHLGGQDLVQDDVHHGAVRVVRHGKHVRAHLLRQIGHPLAAQQPGVVVRPERLIVVERQLAERVHGEQHGARERVDLPRLEALAQRVEDGGFVEERELDEVLNERAVLGAAQLEVVLLEERDLARLSILQQHAEVLKAEAVARRAELELRRKFGAGRV
eukprot:scaffold1070_cov245-Pinguiococcus_pyrenoidosus.AAC.13